MITADLQLFGQHLVKQQLPTAVASQTGGYMTKRGHCMYTVSEYSYCFLYSLGDSRRSGAVYYLINHFGPGTT